jgi:hypothetical protein
MVSRKRKSPASKVIEPVKTEAESSEAKRHKLDADNMPTVFNNFTQGDLLFGLYDNRATVDTVLTEKGFHHKLAIELNSEVVEMVIHGTTQEKIASLDSEKQKHYHFLNKHRDYLMRQPGKPIPSHSSGPIISAALRRACKLLLIHRGPNRKSSSHVITNGIFWKRACSKEISQNGVTDSEMRAAYRDYLNNGPNPHVFFYDDKYKQMPKAPWELEQFKHHWKNYNQSRDQKKKLNR